MLMAFIGYPFQHTLGHGNDVDVKDWGVALLCFHFSRCFLCMMLIRASKSRAGHQQQLVNLSHP